MTEWAKDAVLFALVLCMLAQSAHILVLNQRYPGNTGTLSTLRMLWQDITASGVLDTGLQESVSGRELWPSSVVLLDAAAGDGYLPFCTENDAAQIGEVLSLALTLLQQGQPFFSEKQFEEMLMQDGLLIDLGRTLPVDIAVSLLGESGGPKRQVRYLLITEAENGVQMSMAGEQMMCYTVKGEQVVESYRTCVSHLRSSPSLQSIGVAGRSGLELGLKTGTLYAAGDTVFPVAVGSNALFGQDGAVSPTLLQTALQAFSYNVSTPRRDVEPDGTLVYVENYSNIRLSPDGTLSYKASEVRHGLPISDFLTAAGQESYSVKDVIFAAYALLDKIQPEFGDLPGAGLRYRGASFSEEDGCVYLYFDYVLAGMTIYCEGYEHAATLCYQNGYFSLVTLLLRAYEQQGECRLADFERQWYMAAMQSGVSPNVAELCYEDSLDGAPMVAGYRFGLVQEQEAQQ